MRSLINPCLISLSCTLIKYQSVPFRFIDSCLYTAFISVVATGEATAPTQTAPDHLQIRTNPMKKIFFGGGGEVRNLIRYPPLPLPTKNSWLRSESNQLVRIIGRSSKNRSELLRFVHRQFCTSSLMYDK